MMRMMHVNLIFNNNFFSARWQGGGRGCERGRGRSRGGRGGGRGHGGRGGGWDHFEKKNFHIQIIHIQYSVLIILL